MPNANFLTDEDVAIIQGMIDRSLLRIQNSGGDTGPPEYPRLGPETYLARLPEGTAIPGVDDVADPPIISKADCEIYYINDDDEIVPWQFREETLTRPVWNMTGATLEGNNTAFFLVTRDKFGRFFYVGGGGTCAQNEVHNLYNYNGNSGTFDWTIMGSTIVVDYDVTALELQAQLEGIVAIGVGNVQVTGGPFPFGSLRIEYIEDLEQTPVDYGTFLTADLYQTDDETGTERGLIIAVRQQQGIGA